jgi:hypothetical protein
MSLKVDLESRPTQDDYETKIKECNVLRTELSNLTEQMTCNEKLLEQLQMELSEERERHLKMMDKCFNECGIQTEKIESTKEVPAATAVIEQESKISVLSESPSTDRMNTSHNEPIVSKQIEAQKASLTKLPQNRLDESAITTEKERIDDVDTVVNDDNDDDDVLNNHPKVLYEDELIVFKEKCKSLSDENIRLQRELNEIQNNMGHFQRNWLHNFMLKYFVPILVLFIAYIFFLLK